MSAPLMPSEGESMTEVRVEAELGASVEEVWKIVGDFGGFIEAMGLPVELAGEGIGQTRKIFLGSEPTVERLESLDEDVKRVQYSVVEGGLPVRDYLATMQLAAVGDGRTRLEWSSTFLPTDGMSGDDVAGIITAIFNGGIAGLQGRFGA